MDDTALEKLVCSPCGAARLLGSFSLLVRGNLRSILPGRLLAMRITGLRESHFMPGCEWEIHLLEATLSSWMTSGA